MQTPNEDLIAEAEAHLKALRNSLLLVAREEHLFNFDLKFEPLRSLGRSAELLGHHAIANAITNLIEAAEHTLQNNKIRDDESVRTLLDLIAKAEAQVVKARSFTDEDPLKLLDLIGSGAASDAAAPVMREARCKSPASDTTTSGFDIDPELLEVFSIEAEDLLSKLDENIEKLKARPTNSEALWEIRRHAHTFKGAAGIIGLDGPSRLAHRIEDLLDRQSPGEFAPDVDLIGLIATAVDCLRSMTTGDSSQEMVKRISEIYSRFDHAVSAPKLVPPPISGPEEIGANPRKSNVPNSSKSYPDKRPIVRVSIEKLDELVGLVRDLVVSRTIVDERISEIEEHLDSLSQTTRRFQGVNATIESRFESSLLAAAGHPSAFQHVHSAELLPGAVFRSTGFDPLELDHYTDFHEASRELSESTQDLFAILTSLESLKASIESAYFQHRCLVEETQAKVREIRMIKFGSLKTRLERAVRVTCDEIGNRAEIFVENEDVELDTDVLDALVEPLIHLTRNAVAHGIETPETRRLLGKPETGRITVGITNEDTHVELRVSDDGRGISGTRLREVAAAGGQISPEAARSLDPAGLNALIFLPGLTTAKQLSLSAGRGIGMSIVKESIESRGGSIEVESEQQVGTAFTIRMPLSFGTTSILLVRSAGHAAAVPTKIVRRTGEYTHEQIVSGVDAFRNRQGRSESGVLFLCEYFGHEAPITNEDKTRHGLIIESAGTSFTLIVDDVIRTEDVVIRKVGAPLDSIPGLLGAAVLASGEVVPVLDVAGLPLSKPNARPSIAAQRRSDPALCVLIVDDSPSVRQMTKKMISSAGWDAITAKDGADALEILNQGTRPAVILTDIEMPRMNGFELFEAIRSAIEQTYIHIIIITSRTGDKHRDKAIEMGAAAYLTKPFVEKELKEIIENLTMTCATRAT